MSPPPAETMITIRHLESLVPNSFLKKALPPAQAVSSSELVADNVTFLQNFAIYLESDQLGVYEKLRIIRSHQGYTYAFMDYLVSQQCVPQFVLWLIIEDMKDMWGMLDIADIYNECKQMHAKFFSHDDVCGANISAHVAEGFLQQAQNAYDQRTKPPLALFDPVDVELQEMLFSSIQYAVSYFKRPPEGSLLMKQVRLRDMATTGRGRTITRSKGNSATRLSGKYKAEGRYVVSGAFSDVEKIILKGRFKMLYQILRVSREKLSPEDHMFFCGELLLIAAPHLKGLEFCLAVAEEEATGLPAGSPLTLDMPITLDLLTRYFYDHQAGCGAVVGRQMRKLTQTDAFHQLVKLSRERHHVLEQDEAKLDKYFMEATQALAQALDVLFHEIVTYVPAQFFWALQEIANMVKKVSLNGSQKKACMVAAGLFTLVCGPATAEAAKLANLEDAEGASYFFITLRQLLVKLVERSYYSPNKENSYYNALLIGAGPIWERLWDRVLQDKTLFLSRCKAERLDWASAEEIRASKEYTLVEKSVIGTWKRLEAYLDKSLLSEQDLVVFNNVLESSYRQESRSRASSDAEQPPPPLLGTPDGSPSLSKLPSPLEVKPSITLFNVFATQLREFQAYLAKQVSDEPLLLWTEISETPLTREFASHVYTTYVVDGARLQIPFSGPAVEKMKHVVEDNNSSSADLLTAMSMLMSECGTTLHDHAIDFLSGSSHDDLKNSTGGGGASPRSSLSTSTGSPSVSSRGSTLRVNGDQEKSKRSPRSRSSSTSRLGESAKMVLMNLKSKKKQAEEAALMPAGERIMWLCRRYKQEFQSCVDKEGKQGQVQLYLELEICLKLRGKKSLGKLEECRKLVEEVTRTMEIPALTDFDSIPPIIQALEDSLAPVANYFIATLMSSD